MGGSMRTSRRHVTPGASSSYGARTGMDKVKLGLLRLTDAAPLIVAKELGTFAEEGLDVELSIEPSWANVADKIVYGLLDGAVMLPPLALAVLRVGQIVGFCAGAPWGFIAARGGIGRTVAVTSEIWNNHPEKVLALGRRWAEENLNRVQRLLRALLRAARYCDDAANASRIAALVAETLALDPTAVLASLPGAASRAPQGVPQNADVSTFFANTATFPWRSHALWFLREMARWGYVDPGLDAAAVAASVYRPDLYRDAAHAVGAPVPVADMKAEGEHAGDWTLAAAPAPVAMGADRFCDGAVFDPNTLS